MKRKLLSFAMTVICAFAMHAQVVFDFTNPASMGYAAPGSGEGVDITAPIASEGITLTFDQGGASILPRFWGNTDGSVEGRFYSKQTLTIDATAIAKIEFDGSDVNNMTANVGTFAAGVWTGDASSVVFSFTKTTKVNTISVSAESVAPAVANPVLSPGAMHFTEAFELTMTCATEGATIFYSLNYGEEQAYTGPITINESTAVKAYAKKGEDVSGAVEAWYELLQTTDLNTAAEFYNMEKGNAVAFACELTVTHQFGAYLYVEDAAKTPVLIYLYDAPRYNVGDVLPAGVAGNVSDYFGILQLIPTLESLPATGTPGSVEPAEITTEGINNGGDAIVHKYVVIKGASLSGADSDMIATDANGSVTVFDKFKVELPTDGNAYDIVGIVGIFKEEMQILPISFNVATGVENVTSANTSIFAAAGSIVVNTTEKATATMFNTTGQLVKSATIEAGETAVAVPACLYIVKVGDIVRKVSVK